MKRKLILFVIISQLTIGLFAQNEVDALRYSQITPMGTARFSAMSGAFGALGGDMTTMATNPSGMGVCRKSDFSLSFDLQTSRIASSFGGKEISVPDYSFKVPNIGFVIVFSQPEASDWKNVNFGFAYTKLADFNNQFTVKGFSAQNTVLNPVVDYFNRGFENDRDKAFFDVYTIIPVDENADGNTDYYAHDYLYPSDKLGANVKHKSITSGYMGEYDFSLAANYKDILFIGGSIGIQSIKFRQVITHEENPTNVDNKLRYLEVYDYLKTRGNGINLKIGAIYKPIQMLRFGLAFHTPTLFEGLRDDYYTRVTARVDDPEATPEPIVGTYEAQTNESFYEYNYVSPLRLIGSAAFVFDDYALVSGEVEFVDYGSMNLSSRDDSFDDVNIVIDTTYVGAFNYKLGAEFRLGLLSVRLGGAYYTSAFKSGQANKDANTLSLSGGLGVNTGSVYFDLTYSTYLQKEKYYMYGYFNESNLNKKNTNYLFTVGCRF